jgi:hypothetical protein
MYGRTNGKIIALGPLKRGAHRLQAYKINCIPFYHTLGKPKRYLWILFGYFGGLLSINSIIIFSENYGFKADLKH